MKPSGVVVSVVRVHLDSDGYTKEGRYFGRGPKLWLVTVDSGGKEITEHIRSDTLEQARVKAKMRFGKFGKYSA